MERNCTIKRYNIGRLHIIFPSHYTKALVDLKVKTSTARLVDWATSKGIVITSFIKQSGFQHQIDHISVDTEANLIRLLLMLFRVDQLRFAPPYHWSK